jgi:hypothetical protein
MSYSDIITSAKAIPSASRKTAADGEWFTAKVIKPLDDCIQDLAEELDTADFASLPDVAASAALGNAANTWLQDKDLEGLKSSAENGQRAWNETNTYIDKFATIENNAISGKEANDKLSRYDWPTISSYASQGQSAFAATNYDLTGIVASARSGAAAFAVMYQLKPGLDDLTANFNTVKASAQDGAKAYKAITTDKPVFDDMKAKVNASSTYWDKTIISVTNWNNMANKVLTCAANWDKTDYSRMNTMTSLVSAGDAKWRMVKASADKFNEVVAASAYFNNWVAMVTACHSTNWNKVETFVNASASKLDALPNGSTWQNTYTSVNQASGDWEKLATSATYWNTAKTIVDASAIRWDTALTQYNSSSNLWKAAYNALVASADYWNTHSASNWTAAYDKANRSSPDWAATVTKLNASANSWNTVYKNFSGASGTVDYNKALAIVSANSGKYWNVMKNAVNASADKYWNSAYSAMTAGSANWDTAYTKINNGYNKWNSAYDAAHAGSANWNAAYTYWSNLPKYIATGTNITGFEAPTSIDTSTHRRINFVRV